MTFGSLPTMGERNMAERSPSVPTGGVPRIVGGGVSGKHIEADPTGRAPHQPGAKLDAGKPRIGLVLGDFSSALTEVAKVGTYGANKYTEHGWLSVPNGEARYTDAMYRHLLAENTTPLDPDTGLLHAAHAAWNALARAELMLRKGGHVLS